MSGTDDNTKLPPRRPSNPCNACRIRHLKCDAKRGSCSNCDKGGIECMRGYDVRFRHKLNPSVRPQPGAESKRAYSFTQDQPWVKTGRSLSFLDETEDIVNFYHPQEGRARTGGKRYNSRASLFLPNELPSPPAYAVADSPSPSASSRTSQILSSGSNNTAEKTGPQLQWGINLGDEYAVSSSDVDAGPLLQPRILLPVTESLDSEDDFASQVKPGEETLFDLLYESASSQAPSRLKEQLSSANSSAQPAYPIYLDAPQWPLQDAQQGMLFQYYIENLARLFDMCDQDQRHFATIVPQRAVACNVLLNAILAASAQCLSRTAELDSLVADRYHQNCVKALIPALSTSTAVVDENLLTAIVILRFVEELNVPIFPPGPESHLIGTRVFLAAQDQNCDLGGLRLAAFWVALRQEVFMAFVHSRTVHANFSLENLGRHIRPNDSGCGFANHIILHCAKCLRFCYGSEERSPSVWKELSDGLDQWWKERPWYYRPMWSGDSDSGFFPNEIYLNDAVVTGLQHYHLARILITAHNPEVPRLGPGQITAFKSMNEEIKKTVRVICGIAESNLGTSPAFVNACIAITMAGDRFTDRHEQEALYNILVKTDKIAWPTRSAQLSLMESWGWEDHTHGNMSIAGMLNVRAPLTSPTG